VITAVPFAITAVRHFDFYVTDLIFCVPHLICDVPQVITCLTDLIFEL